MITRLHRADNFTHNEYKLEKDFNLLSWSAYDDRFKPSINDHNFRDWDRKGLKAMCTLTQNGYIVNFQELTTCHGLGKRNHFRYLQLKDHFMKELQTVKALNGGIDVMTRTYSGTKLKVISVPKFERHKLKRSERRN